MRGGMGLRPYLKESIIAVVETIKEKKRKMKKANRRDLPEGKRGALHATSQDRSCETGSILSARCETPLKTGKYRASEQG